MLGLLIGLLGVTVLLCFAVGWLIGNAISEMKAAPGVRIVDVSWNAGSGRHQAIVEDLYTGELYRLLHDPGWERWARPSMGPHESTRPIPGTEGAHRLEALGVEDDRGRDL